MNRRKAFLRRHERLTARRDGPVCICGQEVAVYHKDCLALIPFEDEDEDA